MEEARPPIAELLERAGNLRKHCRSLDSESKTLRGFFDIVGDYEIDDKATAIDAYAGWMQREGKSEGVILSRISFITKWVDEELYREVSEGRLRISQLLRGLRWCQGLRGIRNVKPLFALGTLADVLTKEPPIRDREPNNPPTGRNQGLHFGYWNPAVRSSGNDGVRRECLDPSTGDRAILSRVGLLWFDIRHPASTPGQRTRGIGSKERNDRGHLQAAHGS